VIKHKRHFIGAFVAATAMVIGTAPSATAVPPTERTVNDPVEPSKAYDIVQVVLRSAPGEGKRAVVVVKHGRN